jgi:hypothetical protein
MEPQREQQEMALVGMGLLGSTIVALCCFTPCVVVLLGMLGLGGVTGRILCCSPRSRFVLG